MRLAKLISQCTLSTLALALVSAFISTDAHAVTFHNFSWEGQIAGVKIEGKFSYDETSVPEDGVIRKANLMSFDVSFYDPQNNLMRTFLDNHLTYEGFNFNFDTKTGQILQDGAYSTPEGIDIGYYKKTGENSAIGLNFWSARNHVHFDDFADEFKLPRAFGGHSDISFFAVTTQQLVDSGRVGPNYVNNPNFPLDAVGQRMAIDPVPLPSSILLLAGGLGLMGAVGRRR